MTNNEPFHRGDRARHKSSHHDYAPTRKDFTRGKSLLPSHINMRKFRFFCWFEKPQTLLPQCRNDHSFVTIANVQQHECRWPYGEANAQMVLCGRAIACGSYCADHSRMKHRRNQPGELSGG